jgi:cobalt-zinc-cadmium efflux system protein
MSENRLLFSLFLTFGFVAIEFVAGFQANSLALLSDAAHNFTDGLALILSWAAVRVARRPATQSKTYGYQRAGILAASQNSLVLFFFTGFIFYEAWERFRTPEPVQSGVMIGVALVATAVNILIAVWLHPHSHNDLNVKSAYIHMVGDALASVGVIIAGFIIRYTGWLYADPLISLLIGGFIAYTSWEIVRDTVHILLEGAPKGLNMEALVASMHAIPGVTEVHHLHVWTITDGMNALSCHLHLEANSLERSPSIVREMKTMLALNYDLHHSTIETDCGDCHESTLFCILEAQNAPSAPSSH